MAAAHDLLVSQSWHGADLGDLLRASVAQTIAPTAEQVRMEGPPLMLAPDTAQNLGLAFHELATNASKYGALAADTGELAVTWEREDGEIRIRWRNSGGPPVDPPTASGFGRVLLERLVGATLNGSVDLDFRPAGLVCDIVFPEDQPTAALSRGFSILPAMESPCRARRALDRSAGRAPARSRSGAGRGRRRRPSLCGQPARSACQVSGPRACPPGSATDR